MFRRISLPCLLCLLLLATAVHAFGNGKTVTQSRVFFITFVDTAISFKEELLLQYSDTGKYRIAKITAPKDLALKEDSVYLVDSLAFDDFKDQINKVALKRNIGRSISENSLWEIYEWMLVQINGNAAAPLTGRLHLSSYVQYFDREPDDIDQDDFGEDAYRKRIKETEVQVDKERYAAYKIEQILIRQDKITDSTYKVSRKLVQFQESRDVLRGYLTRVKNESTSPPTLPKEVSDRNKTLIYNAVKKYNELKKSDNSSRRTVLANALRDLSTDLSKSSKPEDIFIKYKNAFDESPLSRLDPSPRSSNFDGLIDLYEKTKNEDTSGVVTKLAQLGLDKLEEYIKAEKNGEEQTGIIKDYEQLLADILRNDIEPQLADTFAKLELEKNQELRTLRKANEELSNLVNSARKLLKKKNIARVYNTEIQFERGFLENVKVIVDVEGIPTIFESKFAIGFTSKYNYAALSRIKLFARTATNTELHIWLADVLRLYDNVLDNYTRDYSPADTVISTDPSAMPRVFLYKARFINLFETKAFTDISGLSGQQPNGILQIEVSRRLNLNTIRYGRTSNFNYGFGNYLNVFGSINKLERNQRELMLQNQNQLVNGQLVSPSYATALDFLKYRNAIAAAELNVFTADFPNTKFTFTADFGAQYGHVPLTDTNRKLTNGVPSSKLDTIHLEANLVSIYPKFSVQIFPERRLGLTFSYQPFYTRFLSNNRFRPIVSYEKSDLNTRVTEPAAHWSHVFEALMKIEINKSSDSYAFLRGRLFWQQGDVNTSFPQIQLGYSYNLNIVKLVDK